MKIIDIFNNETLINLVSLSLEKLVIAFYSRYNRWKFLKVGIKFRSLGRLNVRYGKNIEIGSIVSMLEDITIESNSKGKIKIGNNVYLGKEVKLKNSGEKIIIGDNTTICDYVTIKNSCGNGKIKIGKRVWIAQNCIVEGSSIDIANDVILGPIVHIVDGDHGIEKNKKINKQGIGKNAPIHIGEDVWVGSGSIILRGVSLERGCIIGARSVVTKDIPEYAIAVGSPAKVIKRR